jgi:hypothetical protein
MGWKFQARSCWIHVQAKTSTPVGLLNWSVDSKNFLLKNCTVRMAKRGTRRLKQDSQAPRKPKLSTSTAAFCIETPLTAVRTPLGAAIWLQYTAWRQTTGRGWGTRQRRTHDFGEGPKVPTQHRFSKALKRWHLPRSTRIPACVWGLLLWLSEAGQRRGRGVERPVEMHVLPLGVSSLPHARLFSLFRVGHTLPKIGRVMS